MAAGQNWLGDQLRRWGWWLIGRGVGTVLYSTQNSPMGSWLRDRN